VSERFAVDGIWLGAARGPAALELGWDAPAAPGRLRLLQAAPAKLPRLALTVLPALTDHHVHLGLVERELLADGPLAEVHDLGWVLEEALAWRARPPRGLTVKVAGPFHTAPGGYPSGRYWAPAAAVRALADAADARAAVADAAAAGVDAIKIALHSGMPLLGDEPLQALGARSRAARDRPRRGPWAGGPCDRRRRRRARAHPLVRATLRRGAAPRALDHLDLDACDPRRARPRGRDREPAALPRPGRAHPLRHRHG